MDGPTTSARMPFGVLIDRNGDRVLLGLSGDFSADAGKRFEEAVEEIAREPVANLIVDLSGITFMDQSSAFLLYELYKRFSGHAKVMFEGGSAEIQGLFESAGLTAVLPIAFPGAAHQSTSPGGGPDHDWTVDPTHPHHAVPYVGIPRPGMGPRFRG
jgi:anti-anti-sigma factor